MIQGQTYNPSRGQKSPHHLTLLMAPPDPAGGRHLIMAGQPGPRPCGLINPWFPLSFKAGYYINLYFWEVTTWPRGGGVGWPAMMSGHPNSTHGSCERQRATRCSGRLGCVLLGCVEDFFLPGSDFLGVFLLWWIWIWVVLMISLVVEFLVGWESCLPFLPLIFQCKW